MGISRTLRRITHAVVHPIQEATDWIPGSQYILPAALAAIPGVGPALSGAYLGASNYDKTGSFGKSLASGLVAYGGAKYGGNALKKTFGDFGTIGSNIGRAANAIGGAGSSTSIGASLGNALSSVGGSAGAGSFASNLLSTPITSLAGNAIATNLASSLGGGSAPDAPSGPAPFVASRQAQKELPSSLSGFGSLDQNQQASNIATQGVYGAGLGPQENQYFLNLINRRLVDDSGQVGDVNSVNPIESSYLGQLGLGGYNNSNNLLEAISRWQG